MVASASSPLATTTHPALSSQQTTLFHTSAPRPARRRRRFNSVPAAQMGLVDEESISKFAETHFSGYTTEEKEVLRKKYTPAQLAALEAGEAAIDPRDLTIQGRLRTDATTTGFNYVDDFSQVQPIIDKRARPGHIGGLDDKEDIGVAATASGKVSRVALNTRLMDEDTFSEHFMRWFDSFVPPDVNVEGMSHQQVDELAERYEPTDLDLLNYFLDQPALEEIKQNADGTTTAVPLSMEALGQSRLAPSLGRTIPNVTEHYHRQQDPEDEGLDENGDYKELKRRTSLKVQEMQSFVLKVLVRRWVANQTRLGKVRSSSVLAIAGNGNGWLGLGMAKSLELIEATAKAKAMAIRNMRPVPRYEDRTIYGNVEAKVAGTVVQLSARPPGFGLRVPPRIFEMARAVGIKDLAARIPRSRNPMNSVKATYEALMKQPDPEEIAIGRGKKLVDVRKVYYGGAVY
ncbi:37S ribosomal protein s5 [Niveomyces insectorum RCEF 264]|uniref:Small ribosomal subunit protein uS5m n=1 Tax=Niveomyces insectorum RCEF 264 TaxID=1081102 RepID=A0A167YL36_9HYPO|nr:37S ribosomal protein s5 [Niveomyces insectorum RCEF 264]